MNAPGEVMTAPVTVLGYVDNSGTATLSGSVGGDLKIQGNLTDNGTFNANNRAVFFNGGNLQEISGSGTFDLSYVRISKSGGFVKMMSNLTCAGPTGGNAMEIEGTSSMLDLNGFTLTLGQAGVSSTYNNLIATPGVIRGSSTSVLSILGSGNFGTVNFDQTTPGTTNVLKNLTIDRTSSGLVTIGNNLTVNELMTTTIGTALTIPVSTVLTIGNGCQASILGSLTNNATASGLVIESGGSLINNSASVAATVKRDITKDNKWHFLSSPVSDQEICNSDFAPVTGSFNSTTGVTFDFFRWSEPTVAGNKNWLNLKQTDWLPNTTAFGNPPKFAVKTGYLVAYSSTFAGSATKVFTGTLNTGDQSVTLTIGGNNWNLIGNPFPSAIDWDLVTGKSNLTSAYYYIYNALKSGGAGYEVLSTGYIPAMQGFFVKASTAGSLGFPFTSRVPGGTWLKSTDTEPVNQLSLKLGKDAFYDVTSIIFSLNGSMNKAWYDADKLFSMDTKVPQVYTIKDNNQKICINTLPVIKDPVTVPLGIYIPADGNYTLELSGFESFSNLPGIVLEDLKTNTTRNLAQTPSYTFGALKTDDPARFLLHFAAAIGINEQPENNAFRFYTSENSLFVAGKTGKNQGNVYVYNMMGQLMQQQKLSGETLSVLRLNVPTGYYLVKVITDSQVSSGKVFVN
jgi:hypothetical protein